MTTSEARLHLFFLLRGMRARTRANELFSPGLITGFWVFFFFFRLLALYSCMSRRGSCEDFQENSKQHNRTQYLPYALVNPQIMWSTCFIS